MEEIVYQGYLYLKKARYLQEGINRESVEKQIEYFGRGNSVAALVLDGESDEFIFVRQYRYPARADGGNLIELVAGGIENEDRETAIIREIEEEIGYKVASPKLISSFYVSPGRTDEKLDIFFVEVKKAMKVNEGGGVASEGEDLEVLRIANSVVKSMLKNNELLDGKTILALQHFYLYLCK